MGRKKRFIDPKESVTYRVVHRSQRDPLAADSDAPQRVLQGVREVGKEVPEARSARLEEQHAHGVYYDDDEYNYLQHLKEVGKEAVDWVEVADAPVMRMELPRVVFASDKQEKVGLLNLDPPDHDPKIHWDPDIVAALDEDVDFDDPDNELEDDFFVNANKSPEPGEGEGGGSGSEPDWDSDAGDGGYSDEELDEVGHLQEFNGEETKSRFTSYSMTSSVIRRNKLLSRLDDQFETLYEKYDDDEIGAVDGEEISGNMSSNSELLLQLAAEYKAKKLIKLVPDMATKCTVYEDSDGEEKDEIEVDDGEKWDCESVLTTYSNIYNRPKLIEEVRPIKISHTTGIPMNVLHKTGLTRAALGDLDKQTAADGDSVMSRQSVYSVLSLRSKEETPEERRIRKNNIKNYRLERRMEKKANTTAFKSEKKRQEKVVINLKNNLQGVKIV